MCTAKSSQVEIKTTLPLSPLDCIVRRKTTLYSRLSFTCALVHTRCGHLVQQRFWATVKAKSGRAFQTVKEDAPTGGSRPPAVVAAVPRAAPLPFGGHVKVEAVVEVVDARADGAFEQIIAAVVATKAIVVT